MFLDILYYYSSLEFYKPGIESKDQSRKTQAKDNLDLVGKLYLEGHLTYGSSPLNADLLSESCIQK